MTNQYTEQFADNADNSFADETLVAPEVVKITADNVDEYDFDAYTEDFSDASFSTIIPAGEYVARIDEYGVPSAIKIPGLNGGNPIPRARSIQATLIWDVKGGKSIERKQASTFYVVTKEGKSSPVGKGQLLTAYAAINVSATAEDTGVNAAGFKKAVAATVKQLTEGLIDQRELRADTVGTLVKVFIKVRPEREGLSADGTPTTYAAQNEIDWAKCSLVPEAILDQLASA